MTRSATWLSALSIALVCSLAPVAGAQDVFLSRITVRPDGQLAVATPVNITNRAGYDNQPSFTPDSRSVLYTSTREDQQADIYRYDIPTGSTTRLTSSAPESEYSATVMPRGDRFSVIRVEKDSTQRLWSFAMDGSDPQVVVPDVKPVGYHVWADMVSVALFVLGTSGGPNTLVVYDTRTQSLDTVATNVGRSLASLGPVRMFSYVKREGSDFALYLAMTSGRLGQPRLGMLPTGSEYVAWLDADRVVTGQGSKLLIAGRQNVVWTELADFTATGITRISRLAISPDRQWIAFVAEPRVP